MLGSIRGAGVYPCGACGALVEACQHWRPYLREMGAVRKPAPKPAPKKAAAKPKPASLPKVWKGMTYAQFMDAVRKERNGGEAH